MEFTSAGIFASEGSVYEGNQFILPLESWPFKDDDLNECVRRVVTVERDFWKDYHLAYLLVTLIPTQDEAGTFAGQGRTNAFALFLPQATGLNYFFKHTLAHELFHLWLPGQMNNLDPPIWFSEGFTDYYASRLLLRSGLATLGEVADFYNVRLKEYYLSPVRNISDEQARKDLFKHRYLHSLLLGYSPCLWRHRRLL